MSSPDLILVISTTLPRTKQWLTTTMIIPWSAHHAALQDKVTKPTAVVELLHLFKDNAHGVTMMKHGMDILKKATQHLNPGQVPVVTIDCALYPILKKIQWIWPKAYGADNFVVMMRGLHIEMAFLAAIGDWFEGSGWASIMAQAGVTTEGRSIGIEKGTSTASGQWASKCSCERRGWYDSLLRITQNDAAFEMDGCWTRDCLCLMRIVSLRKKIHQTSIMNNTGLYRSNFRQM